MSSSLPLEIASTLQTASINRHPDPRHDLNPSTAASKKQPVAISSSTDDEDMSDVDEDEIPISMLRPIPRRQTLPPLPDLRFEQSYLRSIEKASGRMAVGWITFRDHVIFPLLTGTLWELGMTGFRYWNRTTQASGNSVGVRIRRWLVVNGYIKR